MANSMKQNTDQRPEISKITTSAELRRWYWLKTELAAEAGRLGLKRSGGKFVILERLCHFHDCGESTWPGDTTSKPQSKFDWQTSELTSDTLITDNYRNTQNVRRFFQTHVDPSFKFTVGLLDWCRENVGKTLGEAGEFWLRQRDNPAKTKIKPHNQFNQYARDFIEDNPSLGMADARRYWAIKKKLPSASGRHEYERSDLGLLDED